MTIRARKPPRGTKRVRAPQPRPASAGRREGSGEPGIAFLFDLDDTLADSVYQHVLAWREALEHAGFELAVWRLHRRIGMSGGFAHLTNARVPWAIATNGRLESARPAPQTVLSEARGRVFRRAGGPG